MMKRKLKTISLGLTLIGSLSYFTVFAEVSGGSGSGGGGCDGNLRYQLKRCYVYDENRTVHAWTECVSNGDGSCPVLFPCSGVGVP